MNTSLIGGDIYLLADTIDLMSSIISTNASSS